MMHKNIDSHKNALRSFTVITFNLNYYSTYTGECILTFPKLPFPRRDRRLKSVKRMTSW